MVTYPYDHHSWSEVGADLLLRDETILEEEESVRRQHRISPQQEIQLRGGEASAVPGGVAAAYYLAYVD